MKELVKIVEKEGKQVVDARDLHFALGVKSNYRDWISNRIKDYGFEEGEDYTIGFAKNLAKPQGGRPEANHLITLDMAKELAMVERSNMGRMIRKYFIEVEKAVQTQGVASLPTARLVYQNIAYTPYITWLIVNGYSVLNARKRMTKHKTQFVKVNEHWYISCELAGALVANKESVKVLNGMQTRMLF
jgi:phage anti-repressor protein